MKRPQLESAREMKSAEENFWLLIAVAGLSVSCGILLRIRGLDNSIVATSLTLLPTALAVASIHLRSGLSGTDSALAGLGDLYRALLLWFYFPIAVAAGFIGIGLGCNEGLVTVDSLKSPIASAAALLMLLGTSLVTVRFLRARQVSARTSIMPHFLQSVALQFLLAPWLFIYR